MVVQKGAKGRPMADPNAPMSDEFERRRKEDSRMIKGIFQDHEVKGGTVQFPFRKWKGDPVEMYSLTDGQEYELPLAVVKHLNSNCCYEEHSYLMDSGGKPMLTGKKINRFSFKTAEYM